METGIEQICTLFDLVSQFNVEKAIFSSLIKQIPDTENVEQIKKFFRGFSYEDHFNKLFSDFPCVIGITGLKQKQNAGYKKNYQVPDYIVIVENIKKKPIPLLIDVKSVKGKKLKCELQEKLVDNLINFSKVLGINILLSIYWGEKFCWTLNSIGQFSKISKKYVIKFEEAYTGNVSHILGDFTYLFDIPFERKRFYRKTEKIKETGIPEYGELEKVFILLKDGTSIISDQMDSTIIDSVLPMSKATIEKKDDITTIIDNFSSAPFLVKLDHIVMNVLATTNTQISYEIENRTIVDFLVYYIITFVKKMNAKRIYNVPDKRTVDMESVFDLIYEDTEANLIYKRQKKI
jgi:hypothetical protein